MTETVNHPAHYGGDSTYEAIKVIEAWGCDFHTGNAVKYICRAPYKGSKTSKKLGGTWGSEDRTTRGERMTSPRPTLAEVDALAHRAIQGKRGARKALMDALKGIPEAIGQKYWRVAHYRGLETADLEQEARLALLAALDTWEPARSTFRNHAYGLARFKVLDAINDAHTVSVPRAIANAAFRGDPSLAPANGKPASPERMSAATLAIKTPAPISTSPTDEDEDVYANPGAPDPGYNDSVDTLALAQVFRSAHLSVPKKKAIAARLGLVGAQSIRELAEIEGVSDETIYRRARRGLARLRSVAGTERRAL